MSAAGNRVQERARRAPGMGCAGGSGGASPGVSDAPRPDASAAIDAAGRLRHRCSHPGCGREGCYGQGGDILRAYADASAGRDASRWLGRWWCREHVPPGFLPQAVGSGAATAPAAAPRVRPAEPPRRQVIQGQGVLL